MVRSSYNFLYNHYNGGFKKINGESRDEYVVKVPEK